MKHLTIIAIIISVLAGLEACQKDRVEFIPTDVEIIRLGDTIWNELETLTNATTSVLPTLNIEILEKELSKSPIEQSFNNEQGGIITSPQNITVEIPANSCVGTNGKAITGQVDFQIIALKNKGELTAQNVASVSSNTSLILGGAIIVKAKKGDQELSLAKNATYKFRFTTQNTPDNTLKFYEGAKNGRFKFDWKSIQNSTLDLSTFSLPVTGSTTDTLKGYKLILDRFGIISWGKENTTGFGTTPLNTLKVRVLGNKYTNTNTNTYIVLKESNSVIKLVSNTTTKLFELPANFRGLTAGQRVTIMTVSLVKNQYAIGSFETPLSSALVQNPINISPLNKSKEEVKVILDAL